MARVLPGDVKRLILGHMPLTKLQEWHEENPNFPSASLLDFLLRSRYDPKRITGILALYPDVLTPFEQYIRARILDNDLAYNGHLYLPIQYMIVLAIRNRDKYFIRYYFDRADEDALGKVRNICLYLAVKYNCDNEIMRFLISRGCKKAIGNIEFDPFLSKHRFDLEWPTYDFVVDPVSEPKTAVGSNKYNFIIALVTLNLPSVVKYINTQTEFPGFAPTDLFYSMKDVYTYDKHRVVSQLRDYLPTKFALNKWLRAYLFLLDILLGRTVEIDNNLRILFRDFHGFDETAYLCAMTVMNKNMYKVTNELFGNRQGPFKTASPYSEIIYDAAFARSLTFDFMENKLLVSTWLANKQVEYDPPVPIVNLYHYVLHNVYNIIKFTEEHPTLTRLPVVPIQNMESGVWLAQYFDLKYLYLVPSTYVNYLNMKTAGFKVIYDQSERFQPRHTEITPESVAELKDRYERQNRFFNQMYP